MVIKALNSKSHYKVLVSGDGFSLFIKLLFHKLAFSMAPPPGLSPDRH